MDYMVSQEVLNIVLAVIVLWVGIFLCWVLYYAAQTFRQSYKTLKSFNDKMQTIEDVAKSIKERFEHTVSYLAILASGIKDVGQLLIGLRTPKSKKKK